MYSLFLPCLVGAVMSILPWQCSFECKLDLLHGKSIPSVPHCSGIFLSHLTRMDLHFICFARGVNWNGKKIPKCNEILRCCEAASGCFVFAVTWAWTSSQCRSKHCRGAAQKMGRMGKNIPYKSVSTNTLTMWQCLFLLAKISAGIEICIGSLKYQYTQTHTPPLSLITHPLTLKCHLLQH